MKKILLIEIPAALGHAIREQLSAFPGITFLTSPTNQPLDLIIRGEGGNDSIYPACPILTLSRTQPLRLGTLLRQIGLMLQQPVLYMDDIALGAFIFKPQEKILAQDDEEILLTDRETDILAYLARCGSNAVNRDELLTQVWQYREGVDTHTLETHIYRLRQKLERYAEAPRILLTDEGGYLLQVTEKGNAR